MFGLFKKKAPPELRAIIDRKIREAYSHIVGQLHGTEFCNARGRIDFRDARERELVKREFLKRWGSLSHNREHWSAQLDHFLQECDAPSATKYEAAATLLIAGLLVVETICKAAMSYPRDVELHRTIYRLVNKTQAGFLLVIDGPDPPPLGTFTTAYQIMREMEYTTKLINLRLGLP
jgi:hypothetical protein